MLKLIPESQREAFWTVFCFVGVAYLMGQVPAYWFFLPFAFPVLWYLAEFVDIFRKAKSDLIEKRRRYFRTGFAMGFVIAAILACVLQWVFHRSVC